MIITLSGVAGVGKSYYTDYISKNLKIERLVITTTREKRENEIVGIDKNFMTSSEIEKKLEDGTFFAAYELAGYKYAFESKYLKKEQNSITELHYEWIEDFKHKAKDVYSIYMIPNDIKKVEEELQRRGFSKAMYEKRIRELEEYQKKIKEDENFKNSFDVVFHNNYDEKSNQKMLELIRKKLKSLY